MISAMTSYLKHMDYCGMHWVMCTVVRCQSNRLGIRHTGHLRPYQSTGHSCCVYRDIKNKIKNQLENGVQNQKPPQCSIALIHKCKFFHAANSISCIASAWIARRWFFTDYFMHLCWLSAELWPEMQCSRMFFFFHLLFDSVCIVTKTREIFIRRDS